MSTDDSAPLPADRGLSALAMLMQLGGTMFAALAGLVAIKGLADAQDPLADNKRVAVEMAILASCAGRSWLHRAAGSQFLYGTEHRLRGVWRYIIVALVQTAFVALLAKAGLDNSLSEVGWKVAILLLWPAVLAIVFLLPQFRTFDVYVPLPEDKGFEGTGIVMILLGVSGGLAILAALFVLFDVPDVQVTDGPNMLVLLSLVALLVRSGLHAHAGFAGIAAASFDRGVELAQRYANFGVISGFCTAGALLMFTMSIGVDVMAFAFVAGLVVMLLAWPLIIRKFFSDRQFAEYLVSERQHEYHRARDVGLTSLGWLLIAFGALQLSYVISQHTGGLYGNALRSSVLHMGELGADRSAWWLVGVAVFQGWAGVELVRMSPVARAISSLYGVVGAAVTLYVSWPLLAAIKSTNDSFRLQEVLGFEFATATLLIMIPLATVILVNRYRVPVAGGAEPLAPSPSA
jgi:hypothetical protein